jgi:copper(I)-binding protein
VNIFRTVVSLVFLMVSAAAWAGSVADQVEVEDPYVRGVPPGQPNSASFLRLTNHGSVDSALVGARSPVAKVVELHTHTMEGGMMRMRPVEKIDLPAGKQVALQPGGLHVMLIGLKQKLVPGERIPLTLLFADGSEKALEAPVRKLQMRMMQNKKMSH